MSTVLHYLVLGDDPDQEISDITVETGITISALKNAIWSNSTKTFGEMESKELRLWSVGVTEDDERLKILTDAAALAAFEKQQTLTSDFIENQLQGELIGRNTVGKLFNLDPKVIHIIVERPSGK
ncbi:hypothetical protein BC936DRAFT_140580 [Jimgerdemannia flammicorona]|uniref:Crinkler effector protein N-terminal domain-containing protein n=1 Tax=Jimgerdemannia flammicorona TaxID=994334 RepID=A0A433ALF0_9FUNG|nr:hypothetical protein BC936DRAFT_140580 [Jimgerdemannia flammicorona]